MELEHELNAVEPPKSLTPRQSEFCLQYVLTSNKAEAARQSGYARQNSSSIGCRLLKRRDIRDYVKALRAESKCSRKVPTPGSISEEYERAENQTAISLASFLDLSDGVLRLRNPEDLPSGDIDVLESVELDPQGRITGYRLKDGGIPSLQRMFALSGDHADQ